ncbi:MAG: GTPase HflX [Dehalococcoidia bacterium]
MKKQGIETERKTERAVLIGAETKYNKGDWSLESSLDELSSLAETAGAQVVGNVTQKMDAPSSTHYIGSGKLQELIELKEQLEYTTAIFNDELSPRQQRNLEDALQVKVIDRTALILDIFASRASTREGQLQVELAQHQYLLPRLAGQWSHLERLGGGIGTRGPGETQIETDRRIIRTKIHRLDKQIEAVRRHRALYREKRKRSGIPVVSLVGYTNAGKSTLLNALAKADVVAENKLFCTLDPVTRKIFLPRSKQVLLTDTVGFIHKLPPSIVAAFRATLEELTEADLLIHVIDITHRDAVEQSQTVERILGSLHLKDKLTLTVVNKVDILIDSYDHLDTVESKIGPAGENIVPVSAAKGWGLDILLDRIDTFLQEI